MGGKVVPHIPDRFAEGYGLNLGALDTLRQAGTRLMVTADCGSSSPKEIEHAGRLGMEVVILDHHTVPPELPAVPDFEYVLAPIRNIRGILAQVSTLLMAVGLPSIPFSTGKGGRWRGSPACPSMDRMRAV